jgi:glutamyl-tRNA synthetase
VPILKEHGIDAPMETVTTVVGLMKGRVSFIKELWDTCKFFFVAPESYDEKTVKKRWKEDSAERMTELADLLESLDDFSLAHQDIFVVKPFTLFIIKLGTSLTTTVKVKQFNQFIH